MAPPLRTALLILFLLAATALGIYGWRQHVLQRTRNEIAGLLDQRGKDFTASIEALRVQVYDRAKAVLAAQPDSVKNSAFARLLSPYQHDHEITWLLTSVLQINHERARALETGHMARYHGDTLALSQLRDSVQKRIQQTTDRLAQHREMASKHCPQWPTPCEMHTSLILETEADLPRLTAQEKALAALLTPLHDPAHLKALAEGEPPKR